METFINVDLMAFNADYSKFTIIHSAFKFILNVLRALYICLHVFSFLSEKFKHKERHLSNFKCK